MSWRRAGLTIRQNVVYNRRLCTATRRRQVEDEGDWFYSAEWWGTESDGQIILRTDSDHGNGVVSVLAYPSSRPAQPEWPKTERWLQERYATLHPSHQKKGRLKILGYQWRTLHFNETTRQSTAKVMAAYHDSKPGSMFLMQQPHCLAVPYLKSMAASGLSALACCDYDLSCVALGKKKMRVLCIGHGGGSLPLFLASKLQGAEVDIVEIDPVVISTSIRAMGFPAFSLMNPSGQRATPNPTTVDGVLWKGIHERLRLYEADAENFILNTSKTTVYDMVFIDAYDGDDVFPRKLWDPDSPFLKALSQHLHPEHGVVVVNLHASEVPSVSSSSNSFFFDELLPMTRHVSKVCRAYKEVIVGNGIGAAFTVSVPWVCNVSLVVCRGLKTDYIGDSRDAVLGDLLSRSFEVENTVNLPFSCLDYIKRDFELVY